MTARLPEIRRIPVGREEGRSLPELMSTHHRPGYSKKMAHPEKSPSASGSTVRAGDRSSDVGQAMLALSAEAQRLNWLPKWEEPGRTPFFCFDEPDHRTASSGCPIADRHFSETDRQRCHRHRHRTRPGHDRQCGLCNRDGPGGEKDGSRIVACGMLVDIALDENSVTGRYLKDLKTGQHPAGVRICFSGKNSLGVGLIDTEYYVKYKCKIWMMKKEAPSPKPDRTGLPYGAASPSGSRHFFHRQSNDSAAPLCYAETKEAVPRPYGYRKEMAKSIRKQQVSFCSDFVLPA